MRFPFLLLALCCAGLLHAEAAVSSPIVVIDLEEVYAKAKLYQARLESLKKLRDEIEGRLKALIEAERKLSQDLDVLNNASERYAVLKEERDILRLRIESQRKRGVAELEARQVKLMADTYRVVAAQLKEYAKEKGHKLVLLAPTAEIRARSLTEMHLQLEMQSTLFADPGLDISASFLGFLNGRFPGGDIPLPPPDKDPAAAPTGGVPVVPPPSLPAPAPAGDLP